MAKVRLWALAYITIVVLVLSACSNAVDWDEEKPGRYYSVLLAKPEGGSIKVSSDFEPSGTAIFVYILPEPGYLYQNNSLAIWNRARKGTAFGSMENVEVFKATGGTYWRFSLSAHSEVNAVFVKTSATGTVSVDKGIKNGIIVPSNDPDKIVPAGTQVKFSILPDPGYVIDPAEFSVRSVSAAGVTGGVVATVNYVNGDYSFTMPTDVNVIVNAAFKRPGYSELVQNAKDHMKTGKYDQAVTFYKEAYRRRSEAASEDEKNEVIFYHSIGKLVSILIDGQVQNLLGSGLVKLHMGRLPTTLDDWMCDTVGGWPGGIDGQWYEFYNDIDNVNKDYYPETNSPLWQPARERTRRIALPKVNLGGFSNDKSGDWPTHGGFPGDFGFSPMTYGDASRQRYFNLYFWLMMCQQRDQGLGVLLENIEYLFFGKEFEDAARIAASFPKGARVEFYPNLVARFKDVDGRDLRTRFYGGGSTAPIYAGKAELDYLFGMLRMVKAAVQYLRAYDWKSDVRPWLPRTPEKGWGADNYLNDAFDTLDEAKTDKPLYDFRTMLWLAKSNILPFKNNLLRVKSATYTGKAKHELATALNMVNNSMNYWFKQTPTDITAGSQFTQAYASHPYKWARDMFNHAKTALDGKQTFYFPKPMQFPLQNGTWPTTMGAGRYGVNTDKFFTAGAFSLDKLFVLETGGLRAPVMYKIPWRLTNSGMTVTISPEKAKLVTGPITKENDPYDPTLLAGFQGNVPDWYVPGAVDYLEYGYGLYSFVVNLDYLRELFPWGFNRSSLTSPPAGSIYLVNPAHTGNDARHTLSNDKALLYQVFPEIPFWPHRPTYLSGPGNEGNLSAQYLYDFYHR